MIRVTSQKKQITKGENKVQTKITDIILQKVKNVA